MSTPGGGYFGFRPLPYQSCPHTHFAEFFRTLGSKQNCETAERKGIFETTSPNHGLNSNLALEASRRLSNMRPPQSQHDALWRKLSMVQVISAFGLAGLHSRSLINQSGAEAAARSKVYRSCTNCMNSANEYCKPSARRSKTLSVGCLRPTSIKEIYGRSNWQ